MSVPRSPEEITPAWLSEALALPVASVAAQPIGAGAGLFGQLARLRLEYRDGAAGPQSIIAKMPTTNEGNREIGNLFQFYEREGRFYEQLTRRMRIRVPRCHYSVVDPAADEHILLLEDFAADSTAGDEVEGCTVERAEAAIRALAAHHASWWARKELDDLAWMPIVNAPVNQSAQQSYQQAWGPYLDVFGADVTPYLRDVGDRMQTKVIELLELFARPPRTMLHGDFRLDNLFFDHEDGSPVAVIDWQISMRGRGMFDVAYFLASSLEGGERRAHEMRLVRLWHDIATEGSTGYSYDEAVEDYRTAVLYCNIYTVIGVGSMDAANERGVALQRAWIRRRGVALEELDCGKFLPA